MKKLLMCMLIACFAVMLVGCDNEPDSDQVQRQQQEALSQQSNSAVGIPDVHHFTEKRLMKLILEKRDDANLATYTYVYNRDTGMFRFWGNTVGYGLPYATQYTNPQKIASSYQSGYAILPQADPNGLFSPASAAGTWILMVNPADPKDLEPIYAEPDITVSPFPLNPDVVEGKNPYANIKVAGK